MAEPLKTIFSRVLVERLASDLTHAWPAFPHASFVRGASAGLERLELLDRARQIAGALAAALPADYERAVDVIVASLRPPLARADGFGMSVFMYLPHVLFVAERGLDHLEPSFRLQRELTKRFTTEFSIRPFLERHPERTLAQLTAWANDPDEHVRRLVSEGTRPRLPWAPRLPRFQADPGPVLALLERLKDDPSAYVRRSVANNLNDIGKDHPALLVDTCQRWKKGASTERRWILTHGLRSLVKKGDARALALLGYEGGREIATAATLSPQRVRVGGRAQLIIEVENRGRAARRICVDFVVHFVKARGAPRPKVFKGGVLHLDPGQRSAVRRSISFAVHTTRTPHPGRHEVELSVNGARRPAGVIEVIAG